MSPVPLCAYISETYLRGKALGAAVTVTYGLGCGAGVFVGLDSGVAVFVGVGVGIPGQLGPATQLRSYPTVHDTVKRFPTPDVQTATPQSVHPSAHGSSSAGGLNLR